MSTLTAPKEVPSIVASNNVKGIENHKVAAKHYEQASKHHLEAAKHIEAGNHEKAALSTVKAIGHSTLAKDAHRDVVKSHTL